MFKIVDVTGYGNSGKTAISDYLKDFDTVASFPNHVEFELFRVKNGLVDMYFSLYENWGLIRSNHSLIEFQKLIYRIGNDSQKYPFYLGNFKASGHNYNKLFLNQFIPLSNKYLQSLNEISYQSFWPYQYFYHSSLKMFFLKIMRKFKFYDDTVLINLTNRNNFLELTSNYINNLFKTVMQEQHKIFMLNNSFDFNPDPCLEILKNGYSIIVERDPRDIFASTLSGLDGYVPEIEKKINNNLSIKRKFLGTDDINLFIQRYKQLRLNEKLTNNPRVFRVRFEDFVLNHEVYSQKLNDFLGIEVKNKKAENVFFNPDNSKKNVGIWKRYKHLPEIIQIEKELAEYCYQT